MFFLACPAMQEHQHRSCRQTLRLIFGAHRSPAEASTGSRRSRSVSPAGLTIAQRQAQLAAQMASTAVSGVENVAASADATRNVAEQALATASHAAGSIEGIVRKHVQRSQEDTSRAVDDIVHRLATGMMAATAGSIEQSELPTRGLVDTLRDELRAKFAEDRAADEARRGQTETRLATLGSSIEGLQKQMNELNVPDVALLVKLEQNLQQKIAESSSDAHVGIEQVSKRLEEQSKTNEDTVSVLNSLAQKIDQLSGNFSTVQADLQRWKAMEAEYNAENMEDVMPEMGNTTVSVPMTVTPPVSAPSFVFGETAEIQPAQPTVSQTAPVSTTFSPSFINPTTRVKTEYSDFSPSFFTAPKIEEAQEFTNTGIPIVPSGNVTPTGQASLPPGAQKTITEICDQHLRQMGINPDQSAHGSAATANLVTPSSLSAPHSSVPSSSGVSNAGGPPHPIIPNSPISVASTPPSGGGRDPFSRISQSVNPQPPHTTFATAQWRPKEPPCFFGRSAEDVHTWTSLVRHYLAFMAGSDAQQVAHTVTLLREAAHEWYTRYERRNRGPPRDWAQLSTALLERFGSNIRSQEAQSQLMSISQGQRAVREYASQFETLLDRLDSFDERLMLNQFIWGLQPELARSVSLHYPKSIAQAVSLAKTTELAVKASRRPGWKSSTTGGTQTKAQGQSNRGRGQGGYFRGG